MGSIYQTVNRASKTCNLWGAQSSRLVKVSRRELSRSADGHSVRKKKELQGCGKTAPRSSAKRKKPPWLLSSASLLPSPSAAKKTGIRYDTKKTTAARGSGGAANNAELQERRGSQREETREKRGKIRHEPDKGKFRLTTQAEDHQK